MKIPPGVRFFGLRLALVASLVVPWLLRAPEVQAPAPATAAAPLASLLPFTAATTPAVPHSGAAAAEPSEPTATPWTRVGFGALLIGIAARVVWLGIGVIRLLRLRRGGVVVDAPEYSELQQQLGTRATITQVPGLSQPATFGVRRPVVLLPDALAGAPASLRRAVVTHELFHVRRRDWLSVLVEEMVRTALWFHPAILWMTSQIQLAREEIVDELTVRATGDRRTYVEALLAFADTPGLSPAPAFAHRRQLFHRILSVSKEKVMSRPRMLSSAAVLLTAVVGASWYASTLFPILKAAKAEVQASAPAAPGDPVPAQSGSRVVHVVHDGNAVSRAGDATLRTSSAVVLFEKQTGNVLEIRPMNLVTPENPIPRRTRGVAPVRPSRFADVHVVISPLVTLDRNGAVISLARDACYVSSGGRSIREDVCDAFFESTAAAIRQWRYDRPLQGPIDFYVHVRYQPGAEPTITQSGESYKEYARDTQESLRVTAEARTVEEERFLRARVEQLIAQSRELERAQRLAVERLRPEHPDVVALQQQLARLNAEMASTEAQLRSMRLTNDDRARVELLRQYQAVQEQYRNAEQQFRTASAQQSQDNSEAFLRREAEQAAEQLRAVERRMVEYPTSGRTGDYGSGCIAPARISERPHANPSERRSRDEATDSQEERQA